MDRYKELLRDLRDYLAKFNIEAWPGRLDTWLSELENVGQSDFRKHLLRTRRALGGMGSIGDIVISPRAGDNIPDDHDAIVVVNNRLMELLEELNAEIGRLLEQTK